MKVEDLKLYFLSRLIKPASTLFAMLIVWALFNFAESYFENKYMETRNNAQSLEAQIASFDEIITRSKAAYIVWQKLKKENFDTVGLRVQSAKGILDKLSQRYLLNNLNINLSTPVLRKDLLKERVGLEYSEINMTFYSYLDLEVFKLIQSLSMELPGMVHFTDINIKASDVAIDDALFNELRKGNYKDLIQVRLTIIWQDYKNIVK